MTEKTVHEIVDSSGTIVTDHWPEGDESEGFGRCINFERCGGHVDAESGIHQFCRPCYGKWASAWFKGGEEE